MGLLNDVMANDAAFAFLDTDGFAELITYKPNGGTARNINAIVNRSPEEAPNGGPRIRMKITIEVANDSVTGIHLPSADLARDAVSIATHEGGTPADRGFKPGAPVSQDSAMIRLELL